MRIFREARSNATRTLVIGVVGAASVAVLAGCAGPERPNAERPALVLIEGGDDPEFADDPWVQAVRAYEREIAILNNSRDFSSDAAATILTPEQLEFRAESAEDWGSEPILWPRPLRVEAVTVSSDGLSAQVETCHVRFYDGRETPSEAIYDVNTAADGTLVTGNPMDAGRLCDADGAERYAFDPVPVHNTQPVIGPDGNEL